MRRGTGGAGLWLALLGIIGTGISCGSSNSSVSSAGMQPEADSNISLMANDAPEPAPEREAHAVSGSSCCREFETSWTPRWGSLVAYWKMNNSWNDSVGGNHGTGQGAAKFTTSSKVGSYAGYFPGRAGSYVRVPNASSFRFPDSSFSIAGWFKSSATGIRTGIMGTDASYPYFGVFIGTDNRLTLETKDSNRRFLGLQGTANLHDGRWHYFTAVRNSLTQMLYLYVDGVLAASQSDTRSGSFAPVQPIQLGGDNSSKPFKGTLDDLAVWSTALSAAEVQSLFSGYSTPKPGPSPSATVKPSPSPAPSPSPLASPSVAPSPGSPRYLNFSGPMLFDAEGICTPLTVVSADASGKPFPVSSPLNVALSVRGAGKFYGDPACSQVMANATIASGQASAVVYFKDVAPETLVLGAAAPGYIGAFFPALSISSTVCTSFVDRQASGAGIYQSINQGVKALQPGQVLCVKSGVYSESLDNVIPVGTASNPVTVMAYPGAVVTIQAPRGADFVIHFVAPAAQYIIVQGFVIDGAFVNYDAIKLDHATRSDATHHVQIRFSEIKNAPCQGILLSGLENSNRFVGLNIHDNGSFGQALTPAHYHGIYISGNTNTVELSNIHHNTGYGVHIYSEDYSNAHDNVVRGNRIYDNATGGASGAGIILGSGDNNLAFNNLVWNNREGIKVAYLSPSGTASGNRVYNNTIYMNREYGIYVDSSVSNTVVQNNIVYRSQRTPGIYSEGTASILSNNLVGVDPKFADEASLDFRLQSTSPAVGAGISTPDIRSWVAQDFDGKARPAGEAVDIGAFGYGR